MTILAACQSAAVLMGKSPPSAVFALTSPFEVELQVVANAAARAIAEHHDWRLLTTLKTQEGDGVTTAFDLPVDYSRMPKKAAVWLNSSAQPMTSVLDLDTWLYNRLHNTSLAVGEWIMLGGQLQVYPVVGASDSVKYYYQSNLIVDPASGSNKTQFTLDTDTFRLNEHMLALEMVWRWKSMKGLDYSEEMQNAEICKAQEVAKDKGSRIMAIGRPRIRGDYPPAYPQAIDAP